MNRDYDDDGRLVRMCTPCIEGTSDENDFVYDPKFGKVTCIYCKSSDTTEQVPRWTWYECNNCKKVFRRM